MDGNLVLLITGVTGSILAFVAVVIRVRGTHNTTSEAKAPTVAEAWKATDEARTGRFRVESMFYVVRQAFRDYYGRQQNGGSKELTASESAAFNLDPANIDLKEPA